MTSCPSCSSTNIEHHAPSGATICMECGVVVEESAIVSSVEFVEGAGGASSMVGQFVSATSRKAHSSFRRYGASRDSQEITLANGRRRIQELASRLRLASHFVDAAHRVFTIAVHQSLVQGRRTVHVTAACLYIACRQEKSQHMLIDFSDAVQVNVYTLGHCFLKLRRFLGLKLDVIDPALYVYRFAAHLDLGDNANVVSMTALRLVARMKRDWIVVGRRPTGICAAALLIAARAHGIEHVDVTRVLNVCGMTVTTRLKEFAKTDSSALSLDQFNTTDVETEADPPIFTKNRIKEARARAIKDGDYKLLESGALDDGKGKVGQKWRSGKMNGRQSKAIEQAYVKLGQKIDEELREEGDDQIMVVHEQAETQLAPTVVPPPKEQTSTLAKLPEQKIIPTNWEMLYPKGNNGQKLVLPDESTAEERQPSVAPTEAKLDMTEWQASLPTYIEDEISDMFRTEDESKEREVIFNKMNKDYLEKQSRKEAAKSAAIANTKGQEESDIAQAEGQARYKRKKSKKEALAAATTTEEQLKATIESRKVSRKINYDALSSIFDDYGAFDTNMDPEPEEEFEEEII